MTKAPSPTEKSKKQRDNIKNATKNFDNTTVAGFQIKIWSQLPWGQPTSEIKLPPRKFTCPSFFVYFHVVISSYLKIYDTQMCCTYNVQLYSPHVQYTQGLEEKSPFALADLYMYLQVVRFWEKANYPCVAKVHSLKISH